MAGPLSRVLGDAPAGNPAVHLGQCGGTVFSVLRITAEPRVIRQSVVTANMNFLVCVL